MADMPAQHAHSVAGHVGQNHVLNVKRKRFRIVSWPAIVGERLASEFNAEGAWHLYKIKLLLFSQNSEPSLAGGCSKTPGITVSVFHEQGAGKVERSTHMPNGFHKPRKMHPERFPVV